MVRIVVQTDDGRDVAALGFDTSQMSLEAAGQLIYGRRLAPLGWLGRALSDGRIVDAGGDPQRPGESAMRLAHAEAVADLLQHRKRRHE